MIYLKQRLPDFPVVLSVSSSAVLSPFYSCSISISVTWHSNLKYLFKNSKTLTSFIMNNDIQNYIPLKTNVATDRKIMS
jgi:hypothetical protein